MAIRSILAQITAIRNTILVNRCNQYLGIDFTPLDATSDEFACMEAVTTILTELGMFPRVETGTWTVNDRLERRMYRNWLPTDTPEPGVWAIAPTGTGYPGTIGHTWIIGNNGIWYSNDSWTGKWQASYTHASAVQSYTVEKGIPIYYYKYITAL